ncbi:hypothetical protein BGX29_012055 [Mortierella sp. GBA35]|nr:hypothetical protein BGX29_012055 [Mortierella sp. GBA35]
MESSASGTAMYKYSHPHPVDIPEIVVRIAYYMPPWRLSVSPEGFGVFKFDPHIVRSCMLVYRLWYQVFVPYLWEVYIDPETSSLRLQFLPANSMHIRIFGVPHGLTDTLSCTSLTRLEFSDDTLRWSKPEDILQRQRDLVRANPRLKFLDCPGKGEEAELEVLVLRGWDDSDDKLAGVLEAVAGSLRALRLSYVFQIGGGEDLAGLSLPHLEELALGAGPIAYPNTDAILACCPNLVDFEIRMKGFENTQQIATRLREHCPSLRAFRISDRGRRSERIEVLVATCTQAAVERAALMAMMEGAAVIEETEMEMEMDETAAADEAAAAMMVDTELVMEEDMATADEPAAPAEDEPAAQDAVAAADQAMTASSAASTPMPIMEDEEPGLVALYIRMSGVRASLLSVVLLHSHTLQEVVLENVVEVSELETVCRVLAECQHLRRFSLFVERTVSGSQNMLDLLTAQPWGCWGLERFDVDFKIAGEKWEEVTGAYDSGD